MIIGELKTKAILLRRILGLTQNEMAELLNMSRQTLSRIENLTENDEFDIGLILRYKNFLAQLVVDDRFDSLLPTQKYAVKEFYALINKCTSINLNVIFGNPSL